MTKHVKLSGAVYGACDHLRMDADYSRSAQAYGITCTPVEKTPYGYAMVIDSSYLAIAKKTFIKASDASRRSAKKQAEVDAMLASPEKVVNDFLASIGRSDLCMVEG